MCGKKLRTAAAKNWKADLLWKRPGQVPMRYTPPRASFSGTVPVLSAQQSTGAADQEHAVEFSELTNLYTSSL